MPVKKVLPIVCSESAKLPTPTGVWQVVAFYTKAANSDAQTHVVLSVGDLAGAGRVLVRVQSECLTSEVFGSLKCDCAVQLDAAMRSIRKEGRGVIVYLRQEGRGIGIFKKIRAYHLQDHGYDTVEANAKLGLPQDSREYSAAAAILEKLGVASIRLMSNNPRKIRGLKSVGVKVVGRVPLEAKPGKYTRDYLRVKRKKMGHLLRRSS